MKKYERILFEKLDKLGEKLGIKVDVSIEPNLDPDIDDMDIDELKEYLADLEDKLKELDNNEPHESDVEKCNDWEEEYDRLELLISDVEDRLEELQDENF